MTIEAEEAEPMVEPLGNNRGAVLRNHIFALERLQEAKDEANADYRERKKLAGEDGFLLPVITAILKRRKQGENSAQEFDAMLREYEIAIASPREAEDG